MKPLLGLSLQPDRRFLELTRRIAEEHADCFEVAPETLWGPGLEPTAAWEVFREIGRRSGKPFLAHGVSLSLGEAGGEGRFRRRLEAVRRDREAFGWLWYSDHLGFTGCEGMEAVLPLPLPFSREAVRTVSERLRALKEVLPVVAFENTAFPFLLGDVREEPAFLNAICREADCSLLLDLHNAYAQCLNFGMDLGEYLDGIDLSRVLEIHLSGGSGSVPSWVPSGRVFRLDSHDGPVPEEVWKAFARVLPRCPGLRAVVLERIETGLLPGQEAGFEAEFSRARSMLCG